MKNLFKQNPNLLPLLNGAAKYHIDVVNQAAKLKGAEYHVGLYTYLDAVQMVSEPDFATKIGNLDINEYRKSAAITSDSRSVWYELGVFTCALDTLFHFVEMVADRPQALINQGCTVSKQDRKLAAQLYNLYTEQFLKLQENCHTNLTLTEHQKYYTFID